MTINKQINHKISQLVIYQLKLGADDLGNRTITQKSLNSVPILKFQYLVTTKAPKIYLVKYRGEIVYVGFTTDSISNRLRTGLAPGRYNKYVSEQTGGSHGYHGYKWKVLEEVDFHVWVFKEIILPKEKHKLDPIKQMFENIESEMVFQIKQQTGKWPKYQSEIHFYSEFDGHKPNRAQVFFELNEKEVARLMLRDII